jgi:Tol biopolymer transport system component/serine/threonine protein kinase
MIGQTVSHYRIVEKIGEGGMGEVYLAEDTSLQRKVALKFLPAALADDELARKRFLREAVSAAALDHPFICHTHEIIRHDSRDVIVMEYVEGRTLQQCLAAGPLPLKQALRIASEIAEALEEAHEKDIVHRDLKPSNIMLTAKGHAEVMDFGLAKKVGGEDGTEQELTTALTREGTTLGTPAYMSPEQVKAEAVDCRSDIFSFGVVLYEMLTGVHPFRHVRQAETIAAILKEEPAPLARFIRERPELLQHTLDRMLAKDPDGRYRSIHEVRTNLIELSKEQRAPVRHFWVTGAAVLITIALLAAALQWWPSSSDSDRGPTAPLKITPFTTDGGMKQYPSFSPDGERVAYDWDGPTGDNRDIWVKALGVRSEPLRLTDDPGMDVAPEWSPDGREIAFTRISEDRRRAAIYRVPSLEGQEQKLVDRQTLGAPAQILGQFLALLSWSPDGRSLVFSERESREDAFHIVQISIDTLEKKVLTHPTQGAWGDAEPEFSPDGSQIAFLRASSNVAGRVDAWVQSVSGGAARRLTELESVFATRPAWTADGGSIVFTAAQTSSVSQVWRVDVESGKRNPVAGPGQRVGFVGVWKNLLVFVQRTESRPQVHRVAVAANDASESEQLTHSTYGSGNADISPDGRQIVFESTRSGYGTVWKCNIDGSNCAPLTDLEEKSGTPRWSPDGKTIVFDSLHSGNWDLWLIDAEGGIPRQLTTDPSDENMGTWSHDGRWIYFASTRTGRSEIYRMPAEGGESIQLTRNGGFCAVESRDGRYVYYISRPGLWRLPSSGQGEEERVLSEIYLRNYAVGKKGVYFAKSDHLGFRIHFLDFGTGEVRTLYRKQGRFEHGHDLTVSRDEKWLLFTEFLSPESELILAENFR